jgi:hypothetical protein
MKRLRDGLSCIYIPYMSLFVAENTFPLRFDGRKSVSLVTM